MAAHKENQFWKLVKTPGRKPLYSDPQKLWDDCLKYVQWCADNPLEEERVFHNSGKITKTSIRKMRAMTQEGLCLYLGMTRETWTQYSRKEGFSDIVKAVNDLLYVEKFSGAAADLLNSNIISRELGLKDRHQIETQNDDLSQLTDDELHERIKRLESETGYKLVKIEQQ